MEGKLEEQTMRIDDVRAAVRSLEERTDRRFDQIDSRFVLVDQRFLGIDARFERLAPFRRRSASLHGGK
jgi:hypothetical protein